MISVIADDFTGAAEIGGIGLRHGMDVIIENENVTPISADLVVIASNTRSLDAEKASERITAITERLLKLDSHFIYKKTDSVLRGHVCQELQAQMVSSGKTRAIVIAANPVLKRIIRDGIYYIDDVPLNDTSFATDPEFPVSSSSVREIVGDHPVFTGLKPRDHLPEMGIIIGDATGLDDLEKWTHQIDRHSIPAGASGFFNELLKKQAHQCSKKSSHPVPFGEKALYVLGSAFPKDDEMLKKIVRSGHYISNMPEEIYFNRHFDQSLLKVWADEITDAVNRYKKVVAAVIHAPSNEPGIAQRIRKHIGRLTQMVTRQIKLNELIIEGGSTTACVLEHLKIKKLMPVQELDTGVIRMKIEEMPDLCLTTKPGSYSWPDMVWLLHNDVQYRATK